MARLGVARHGRAWRGMAWRGEARRGEARHGYNFYFSFIIPDSQTLGES